MSFTYCGRWQNLTALLPVQCESGRGYNLNQSLFERLILCGHPVTTLQQQRRMRPAISALIRQTIYPELQVVLPPSWHLNMRLMFELC